MEITPKLELIVRIFCFLLATGICIAIYVHGKDLSCDKCVINFANSKANPMTGNSNTVVMNFTVPIQEMYEEFLKGRCIVKFDEVNGFYYTENINVTDIN